jgi:hypothetical protein
MYKNIFIFFKRKNDYFLTNFSFALTQVIVGRVNKRDRGLRANNFKFIKNLIILIVKRDK